MKNIKPIRGERVLYSEQFSAVRELYKNEYSEEDIRYIETYVYSGKTINEWDKESKELSRLDDSGKPLYYTSLTNMMDGIILARLMLNETKKYRNE